MNNEQTDLAEEMSLNAIKHNEHTKNTSLWSRYSQLLSYRITIAGWIYGVLFVICDILTVFILQVGIHTGAIKEILNKASSNIKDLLTRVWRDMDFVIFLNMLLVAFIYLIVLLILNRFWIASLIMVSAALIISVIETLKVSVRGETVQPADLSFLGNDTGNIAKFLPPNTFTIVSLAFTCFVVVSVLCIGMHVIDAKSGKIVTLRDWRYAIVLRAGCLLTVGAIFVSYVMNVGTVGSWANVFANNMGDSPAMWDSVFDARINGPLVGFLRQVNPKVMDKPENYSEETMRQVLARYRKQAERINAHRSYAINDTTVVFVLSESFSDPQRVPGLSLNHNPIPFITELKKQTDSGLMLSSGYGGGTANLEYMALTGMSMANFDPSLTSPYQQLIQHSSWTPTINQYWGEPAQSLAYHPFYPSMYSRSGNYKKFGFSRFYSLNGRDIIRYQNRIDKAISISDESAYASALEGIQSAHKPRFIQLVTMQNHMPFNNWYEHNEFIAQSKDAAQSLGEDEKVSIQTYAKGANYTDKATKHFLQQLDAIDHPVSVVFYGDHLPGVYASASSNAKNSLALHLTDYFIWSNKAARQRKGSHVKVQQPKTNEYSSPNFFIAQFAEHANARVSPFVAFLTQLHERVSAIEPPVVNDIQSWSRIPQGKTIYLDKQGNIIKYDSFDASTKQLLEDYRLIQYDVTVGKHYLRNTSFMTMPR